MLNYEIYSIIQYPCNLFRCQNEFGNIKRKNTFFNNIGLPFMYKFTLPCQTRGFIYICVIVWKISLNRTSRKISFLFNVSRNFSLVFHVKVMIDSGNIKCIIRYTIKDRNNLSIFLIFFTFIMKKLNRL